jgi:hypothetical protein
LGKWIIEDNKIYASGIESNTWASALLAAPEADSDYVFCVGALAEDFAEID